MESIRDYLDKYEKDLDAGYAREKAKLLRMREVLGATEDPLLNRLMPIPANAPKAGSKAALALEMLRRPDGASVEELMQLMGWIEKSVRGFLSGVVRKKLQLHVESVKVNGVRRYRIQT
jgi:hypothetical protein